MNNRKTAGIITAVVSMCALITVFNVGMSTPLISWPLEAYLGVAFTIGWLTHVPVWLAYLLSALVFVLIATACYKIGSKVYGWIAGHS